MDWVVGVRAGGLIRGVIKLLWHICRDRVKLKVTCSEPEEGWVHLMVLNSSAFPVKITEVGFVLYRGEEHGLETFNENHGIIEAHLDLGRTYKIKDITNLSKLTRGVEACFARHTGGKLKKGLIPMALKAKLVEAGKAAGSS